MGAPVPHQSLYILDPLSAAVNPGNAVCSQPGKESVTLMTTAAIAAGGQFCGVAIQGWGPVPSGLQVADSGLLDSSLVNLGNGVAGPVYATAVGVLSRTVLGPIIGTCDAYGNVTVTSVAPTLAVSNAVFGDGSDGALVYDGVTTILGMAPSANVYTLTRDIFASNLTINTGITVVTAGFRVFTSGTLTTLGTGSLTTLAVLHNGGNGAANTAGAAGTAPGTGTILGGFAGGIGGAGSNTGTAGTNATASRGLAGQTAGAGGAGGAGGANAGGAASTWSAMTAAGGSFRALPAATQGWIMSASATVMGLVGGAGGGGGGSNNVDAGGGGGGSGGGVLIVAAQEIINNGSISANGGKGGNGFSTANNAGGGGGGGGGVALIVSRVQSGNVPTAAGGLGGALAGAGVAGAAGSAGTVIQIAA